MKKLVEIDIPPLVGFIYEAKCGFKYGLMEDRLVKKGQCFIWPACPRKPKKLKLIGMIGVTHELQDVPIVEEKGKTK